MAFFSKLHADMRAVIGNKQKIDPETQEQLANLLIGYNFGPQLSRRLAEKLSWTPSSQDIQEALRDEILKIVRPVEYCKDFHADPKPFTLLLVGTNGSGKTTSAGKLAFRFCKKGYKVTLVAADTFRAAAVEQLGVWAERAHAHFIKGKHQADPASVAFQALEQAIKEHRDLVIIDTAGRMHTSHDLMDELSKMIRIVSKKHSHHEVFLVIEATTGQNAIQQIALFQKSAPLAGLIVTKLDGSGKGGVIVRIADEYKLPVYALGTGEGLEDLEDFSASHFVDTLLGKNMDKDIKDG